MREKLNFDRNWKFALGDIEMDYPRTKPPASYSSKTERAQWGPASFSYDTGMYASEHWSDVDLPHDYTIHELPDEKYNEAHGFFPRKNAWYRKTFKLENLDCAVCAEKMKNAIAKIDGVESVDVSFMLQKLTISAPEEKMEEILKKSIKAIKKVDSDCKIIL